MPVRIISLLLVFALAACAAPYAPPIDGPTAKLDIAVNSISAAQFDIVEPSHHWGTKPVLTTKLNAGLQTATVRIAALQPVRFIYTEAYNNVVCNLRFGFTAEPEQHYAIWVGDAAAPKPTTTVGKILKFFANPMAGGQCFMRIYEITNTGATRPVQIFEWSGDIL